MTSSTSIMVELTPHEQLTSAQKQATGVIVKLTSEMSKKTLVAQDTRMRAVVVPILGTRMLSEPSFGVLATKAVG